MMNKVYQLIKTVGIVGLLLVLTASAQAQVVGVKTNILYLATASPNIGIEWPMGKHFTGSLGGGYNPFRFGGGIRIRKEIQSIPNCITGWEVARCVTGSASDLWGGIWG